MIARLLAAILNSKDKRIWQLWPRGMPLPPKELWADFGYSADGRFIGDKRRGKRADHC